MNELSRNIAAFCALLREEHGFAIGHAEAHDALRALEVIGLTERARVRSALRLVCCGSLPQLAVFDRAFDAFFSKATTWVPQPAYQPRHTRPGRDDMQRRGDEQAAGRPKRAEDDGCEGEGGAAAERRPLADESDDARALPILRARYSPAAAQGEAPAIAHDEDAAMLVVAERMIASVRLGRSRRWRAIERGGRFDLRRTIRASLQTGGDPVELRFRGHPLRNPRFAVLIDGSRSICEQTDAIVSFARALCARTIRANAFFFSTELRDVTRALRAGGRLTDLGAAWGGGTKIGASLAAFMAEHGPRVLSPDTVVMIFSDGLDVGDVRQLERAMRDIDRRSAGIVWLNPHVASPGYAPTARGMRAALPYVTILAAANDASDFERLAQRVARDPRIRGRRR